jgi:hypothetical protein
VSARPLSAYLRAELILRPTEGGGRRRPISSGYRCNCWIGHHTDDGDRSYNDAVIYLDSADQLHPGEQGVVAIQPAFPDLWNEIGVGSRIEVCEGSRVVGEATVIELFPS